MRTKFTLKAMTKFHKALFDIWIGHIGVLFAYHLYWQFWAWFIEQVKERREYYLSNIIERAVRCSLKFSRLYIKGKDETWNVISSRTFNSDTQSGACRGAGKESANNIQEWFAARGNQRYTRWKALASLQCTKQLSLGVVLGADLREMPARSTVSSTLTFKAASRLADGMGIGQATLSFSAWTVKVSSIYRYILYVLVYKLQGSITIVLLCFV